MRLGVPRSWRLLNAAASFALGAALVTTLRLHDPTATFALAPAAFATLMLVGVVYRHRRPGATAFWGVGLYATTVTGLAAAYALAAPG